MRCDVTLIVVLPTLPNKKKKSFFWVTLAGFHSFYEWIQVERVER